MYEVMKGVRVVEVAGYVFVPVAGAILADWGADVIKVEHPVGGDPYRGLRHDFVQSGLPNPMLELPNRGKRSIGLDISKPEGMEILYGLVRDADVFSTSFMSETVSRLGIDFESICKQNPSIVYARGTGYGTRGPDADKRGFDATATWARAGLMQLLTPTGSAEPARQPGSIGDLTGGLALTMGIAAALFRRERTGEAQEVDVSLFHVGMWITSQSIAAAPLGLQLDPMRNSRTNPPNPLVNSYRTADDRWLLFCMLQPDPYWPDFCRHVGCSELIEDPRFADIDARRESSAELVRILDRIFSGHDLAEWRRRLATLKGAWSPALSPAEIGDDPQVLANGYFPDIDVGEGPPSRSVAAPVQFGGEPGGSLKGMPEHGAQTEEILLELGYSWDEINAWKVSGTVL